MQDSTNAVKEIEEMDIALSAGGALRHEIFNKITPILLQSDGIHDSNTRLTIQACCLDVVTSLEEVIERYRLDETEARRRK